LANARGQSARSGKPLFAVVGADYCPACKALMERLKTDESLSEFASHYVAVSVTYGDDPAWSQWNAKYPIERNAIPRLYIIDSNGKAIYAKAGAPQGQSLVRLLRSSLEKSGPGVNEPDARALVGAVERAEAAAEAGDLLAQAVAIAEVQEIAANANAFDPSVRTLRQIYESMAQTLEDRASNGTEDASNLADLETPASSTSFDTAESESTQTKASGFTQVLDQVTVASSLALFPQWRERGNAIMKELRKNRAQALWLQQSEALVKARKMAAASDPKLQNRSSDLFAVVLKRFPSSEAAILARDELAELTPDHAALPTNPGAAASAPSAALSPAGKATAPMKPRTWTSLDGNFSRTATLLQQTSTHVQLRDPAGKTFAVAIAKLCDADRAYLEELQAAE
tara:strand:+ start:105650 stop:106846 length:1197 start_codon:yes stop_codon:yes gene_type:complete